jgi:hypothetical protein
MKLTSSNDHSESNAVVVSPHKFLWITEVVLFGVL